MKTLLKISSLFALILILSTNQTQASSVELEKHRLKSERSNWNTENIRATTRGEITFNDDYTDVIEVSDGGFLNISMVSFGMRRKLMFTNYNGKLERYYYEGNRKIDFEPKGREWMEEVLHQVVRNSGLDLENRVNKVYKKGGVKAFLNELDETDSDYFKSQMVSFLLENNKLSKKERKKLIEEFPMYIRSDYELARIFKNHNQVFVEDSVLAINFFDGLNRVNSDYERSQVLNSVFRNNTLNNDNFKFIISAMSNIDSDYEKSNLIKLAIEKGKNSGVKLDLILDEVDNIDSDYEKGLIIKSVINDQVFEIGDISKIIELSKNIASEYENTKIMKDMIKHEMITPKNKDEFRDMMRNISSDYSYKEILMDFMEYDKLGDESFEFLMEASEKITSSYELGQFYMMMLNKNGLSTKQQIELIKKSNNITSNYDQATFLLQATHKLDLDNEKIQNALIDATQEIDSEYEYGRIMKVIYSHKRK